MRLLLLHNPKAGSGNHAPDRLTAALERAGYEVLYRPIRKSGIADALREKPDVVALIGGDGTVGRAICNLRDRTVPVAIFPSGTANNIATSLGITGTAEEVAEGLPHAHTLALDIGKIAGLGRRRRFIESVGFGELPRAMKEIDKAGTEGREQIVAARHALARRLAKAKPERVELLLDGEEAEIEALFVEVMIMSRVGPQLFLCDTNPGDGVFDVVWVGEAEREAMVDWLNRDPSEEPAPVQARRAGKVAVRWRGSLVCRDDEFRTRRKPFKRMTFKLEREPARILVPLFR